MVLAADDNEILTALERLNPAPVLDQGPHVVEVGSAIVAVVVLAAWIGVILTVGGWRTATRDA